VRDQHRCRFPGCNRTIGDIHHLQWWEKGGHTNIDNGLFLCDRHHTLIHKGYNASGNANHDVTFRRPDGSLLGTTGPRC
jgi:predicted restriction endonuclease